MHVPTWVAAVAAVVVAFLIGVAGFAIGHASAEDGRRERPGILQGDPPGANRSGSGGPMPSQGQGGQRGPGGSAVPGRQDSGNGQAPGQGGSSSSSGPDTSTRGS